MQSCLEYTKNAIVNFTRKNDEVEKLKAKNKFYFEKANDWQKRCIELAYHNHLLKTRNEELEEENEDLRVQRAELKAIQQILEEGGDIPAYYKMKKASNEQALNSRQQTNVIYPTILVGDGQIKKAQ
jgi:hypothetical protein